MPPIKPSVTGPQTSSRAPRRTRARVAIVGAGLGLLLGPLALASPALAERDTDSVDRPAPTDRPSDRPSSRPSDRPSDRPADPAPPNDKRPDRDLEVLRLHCAVTDGQTDSATRVHIGCRWRPAQHPRAAGYQLWRIVDRGERELVARGGLDMTGARDVVSAKAHLVRYAVIAVDANGQRIGQSRVQRVVLHDGPRPVRSLSYRIH